MAKSRNGGGGGDGDWLFWLLVGGIGGAIIVKKASEPEAPRDIGELMATMVKKYRTDNRIRRFIGQLVGPISPANPIARIERIFRFVADKISFVDDPGGEHVATPVDVLQTMVGDCDCKATTLATLLEAAGFPTRFVLIPRHVFVEVGIDPGLVTVLPKGTYKRRANGRLWVPLESTGRGNRMGWINVDGWRRAHVAGQERVIPNHQ